MYRGRRRFRARRRAWSRKYLSSSGGSSPPPEKVSISYLHGWNTRSSPSRRGARSAGRRRRSGGRSRSVWGLALDFETDRCPRCRYVQAAAVQEPGGWICSECGIGVRRVSPTPRQDLWHPEFGRAGWPSRILVGAAASILAPGRWWQEHSGVGDAIRWTRLLPAAAFWTIVVVGCGVYTATRTMDEEQALGSEYSTVALAFATLFSLHTVCSQSPRGCPWSHHWLRLWCYFTPAMAIVCAAPAVVTLMIRLDQRRHVYDEFTETLEDAVSMVADSRILLIVALVYIAAWWRRATRGYFTTLREAP